MIEARTPQMGPPTVHVGGSQSNVAWLKDPHRRASTDSEDSRAGIVQSVIVNLCAASSTRRDFTST